MNYFSCEQIFEDLVAIPDSMKDKPFLGFCHDSRSIETGQIFLAFSGQHAHGLDYAKQALDKGALAIIAAKGHDIPKQVPKEMVLESCPYILLKSLSRKIRQKVHYPLIAVTGSAGKTTWKHMAKEYLGDREFFFSKGNWNNQLGIMLNMSYLKPDLKAAFFECGISYPGEMSLLASLLQPDYVVITSLDESHLQTMNSIETVAREKIQLAQYAKKLYWTNRSALTAQAAQCSIPCPTLTITVQPISQPPVGLVASCEVCLCQENSLVVRGQSFERPSYDRSFDELWSLLISLISDIDLKNLEDLKQRSLVVNPLPGRGRAVHINKNLTLIDHTYNCSPPALRSIFDRMKYLSFANKVLVIGPVAEQPESLLKEFFKNFEKKLRQEGIAIYIVGNQRSLWPDHVRCLQSPHELWEKICDQPSTLVALSASRTFRFETWLAQLEACI